MNRARPKWVVKKNKRRNRNSPRLTPMEAFTPRIRKERWQLKAHFRRYHPLPHRHRGLGRWQCMTIKDFFYQDDEGHWLPLTRRTHRQRG